MRAHKPQVETNPAANNYTAPTERVVYFKDPTTRKSGLIAFMPMPDGTLSLHVHNADPGIVITATTHADRINRGCPPDTMPTGAIRTEGRLTKGQQIMVNHYKALNVPAEWFIGEPNGEGEIRVIAVGDRFIWSFLIGPDGECTPSEASFPDGWSTGITC